ncbi:MAG: ADP-ribosylglycohydrolase family protein [Bacteroides fragilis]
MTYDKDKIRDRRRDRVAGAMYGVAVGDALGGPLEFMAEAEIKEKYGLVTEMIGGGWLNLEPGETTDDTAMTLAVAEGIMVVGEYYKNSRAVITNIGQNFLDWYDTQPKDVGNTCAAVINYVKNTGWNTPEAWMNGSIQFDRNSGGRSGGNGALMRTVPVGLVYNWADDGMHEGYTTDGECSFNAMATTIARMTHWDGDAAKLVCDYSRMISRAARYDFTIGAYIEFMEKYKQDNITPSGYSLESMAAAIWACKTTNFENSLIRAVNLGGDADTIGAIAGGMAGAYYGYSQIPARWIKALPDEIKTRIDRFVDWAVDRIMEEK